MRAQEDGWEIILVFEADIGPDQLFVRHALMTRRKMLYVCHETHK